MEVITRDLDIMMLAFLYSLVLTKGTINLDVTPTGIIEVNGVQIILKDYLIGTYVFLPCIKLNKPLIGFQISTEIISVISLKKKDIKLNVL